MKRVATDVRTRLYFISAIMLVVGLTSAVLIYYSAGNAQRSVLGYEVGSDGTVYPIMPEDSKAYMRGLELYGGKANVITDKFRRWFVGLWLGKSLAYTVAFLTVLVSIIVFSAAHHLPDGQNNRNKAG